MKTKNVLLKVLALSMLFLGASCSREDDPKNDGSGSNLCKISNADELFAFAERVNAGEVNLNAELTADIDITGRPWTPISWRSGYDYYAGHFNGNSHSIIGLTITEESIQKSYNEDELEYCSNIGLFSHLDYRGAVEKVKLTDVNINLPLCYNIGAVVADCSGQIGNCSVSGVIVGKSNVGGIVGTQANVLNVDKKSLIFACKNYANIKGETSVGGIVAATNGYVISVSNSGTVEAKYNAGGIVAQSGVTCEIFNAKNSGTIICTDKHQYEWQYAVGGIVGLYAGKLSNSVNTGTVKGISHVGGIIGMMTFPNASFLRGDGTSHTAYVENCLSSGVVSGTSDAAPMIGEVFPASIGYTYSVILNNCFYYEAANPLLEDSRAEKMDAATLTTLNEWVARKVSGYRDVKYKEWYLDEATSLPTFK